MDGDEVDWSFLDQLEFGNGDNQEESQDSEAPDDSTQYQYGDLFLENRGDGQRPEARFQFGNFIPEIARDNQRVEARFQFGNFPNEYERGNERVVRASTQGYNLNSTNYNNSANFNNLHYYESHRRRLDLPHTLSSATNASQNENFFNPVLEPPMVLRLTPPMVTSMAHPLEPPTVLRLTPPMVTSTAHPLEPPVAHHLEHYVACQFEPSMTYQIEPMTREIGASMAHQSRPMVARQSGPMVGHQSRPMVAHQSGPPMAHQSRPMLTRQSRPMLALQNRLIGTRQNRQMVTRQNQPMVTCQNQPMVTCQNQPMVTRQNGPIITRQNGPIITRQNGPIITRQNGPLVTRQNGPIITRQNGPIITRQNGPLVTRQNGPMVTRQNGPIVAFQNGQLVARQNEQLVARQNETLVTHQIRSQMTSQSRTQMTSQSRPQMASQSRPQMTSQSRPQMTSQSRPQMTSQSRLQMTSQSMPQMTSQSRLQMTSQSRPQMTSQSRPITRHNGPMTRHNEPSVTHEVGSPRAHDVGSSVTRQNGSPTEHPLPCNDTMMHNRPMTTIIIPLPQTVSITNTTQIDPHCIQNLSVFFPGSTEPICAISSTDARNDNPTERFLHIIEEVRRPITTPREQPGPSHASTSSYNLQVPSIDNVNLPDRHRSPNRSPLRPRKKMRTEHPTGRVTANSNQVGALPTPPSTLQRDENPPINASPNRNEIPLVQIQPLQVAACRPDSPEVITLSDGEESNDHVVPNIRINCKGIQCEHCMQIILEGEGIRLGCYHVFCRRCLRNLVLSSHIDSVRCPFDEGRCEHILTDREIREFLSQQEFRAFESRCVSEIGSYEPIFKCRTPNCRGWTYLDVHKKGFICILCNAINLLDEEPSRVPTFRVPRSHVPSSHVPTSHVPTSNEENGLTNSEDPTRAVYTDLMSLENQDLVNNFEEFECPICLCHYGIGEGATLKECLHSACKECLAGLVEHSDGGQVRCPFRNNDYECTSFLQEREIRVLVNPAILERYHARSVTLAENQAQNSYHCRTPDCRGWWLCVDAANSYICPVCRKLNCVTCSAIHEQMNCRQYQEWLELEKDSSPAAMMTYNFLKEQLDIGTAMLCPSCKVVIMKVQGCDWVMCTMCKLEICWMTKGPRWGPNGKGDTSGGCKCTPGNKCHPNCKNCH